MRQCGELLLILRPRPRRRVLEVGKSEPWRDLTVQAGLHSELRKIAVVAVRARRSLFFEGRIDNCAGGRGAEWVLEVWSYNEESAIVRRAKGSKHRRDTLFLWVDVMSGGGGRTSSGARAGAKNGSRRADVA